MPTKFKDEIKTRLKDNKTLLLLNIMYTASLIEKHHAPIFKRHQLTRSQYNILRILKGSSPKPLSVGDIKERIIFKQTDITRMIDRLVEKGLVYRKLCDNNRRKMDVTITSEGKNILDQINPSINEIEQTHFYNQLSNNEALIAGEILDKLRG